MPNAQERTQPDAAVDSGGADTEPITLVQTGDTLGSIFGMLDPATISSCSADGTCN
ncbi:hypothetical protein [Gulosibacter chungangensis]|uniref:hypothetical protein n=1 Tax=Gulosibacter chungangensis TaxID=979746 RepID=UPI001787EAFB|nr:hypothetical protein [Gulosibacter chungangensis]